MLLDSYFMLDILKEIDEKFSVLQSLVGSNGDSSQQQLIVAVCKEIGGRLDTCRELIGDLQTDRMSAIYRHLGFIMSHPSLAQANLDDILRYDFPTIRDLILKRVRQLDFAHPVLQKSCATLYAQRHYTAAIREAFSVWKEHACATFDLPNTLDGHALIDQLFSRTGRARRYPADDMQVAFLEYCKSVYSLFRNKLSHSSYQATPYDVDAALAGINLMLHHIDEDVAKHDN